MKNTICLLLLLLLSLVSQAQPIVDPKAREIILRADEAGRKVHSIQFNSEYWSVSELNPDSVKASGNIQIVRNSSDTLLPVKLRMELFSPFIDLCTYDGSTYQRIDTAKKTVVVAPLKDKPHRFIGGNTRGRLIPWFLKKSDSFSPMLTRAKRIEYLGVDTIANDLCHHIKVTYPDNDNFTGIISDWYIALSDNLPRRSRRYVLFDGKPDIDQLTITNVIVNPTLDTALFSLATPPNYTRELYVPYIPPKPLASGAIAPDWTLPDSLNNSVKLTDFKGKLLLLDFWYISCLPCIQAIPSLEKLHQRFHHRGFSVVGVNVFDESRKDPIGFVRRKGGNYPIVLNGKAVATNYHVTGYPTFYLINDDGVIVQVQEGYSEELEEELSMFIDDYLKKQGR